MLIDDAMWCEDGGDIFPWKRISSISRTQAKIIEYNSPCYTNFVISLSNKKSVLVQCKHAREKKSESSGK